MLKFFIIYLMCYSQTAESAKILSIFSFPSKSYYILHSALLNALAKRGHEVTMLSPFEATKNDNFTTIALKELLSFKQEVMGPMFKPRTGSFMSHIGLQVKVLKQLTEEFWKNAKVQELIKSNDKYDLVILSIVFNESVLGLAKKLNATTILLNTMGSTPLLNKLTGNPEPISYVPTPFIAMSSKMSFFQRTVNFLMYVLWQGVTLREDNFHQNLLDENIPNSPKVSELLSQVPLVLLNAHYSIEFPRPYVPNMIPIGGFHIKEPQTLEEPFKTYMDSAKDGAIIVSFGSVVNISSFNEKDVRTVLKSLGKLNLKVLFKSEKEFLNISNNIRIEKWIPQNDLLGHPNTKLFISHGGLLSTTESVYHGVPIIGMPVFADQTANIARVVDNGYGIRVDITQVTEKIMDEALNLALNNVKFKENIKKRSELIKNQPIKPLDHAVYWVEHILTHKNGDHLRNYGAQLNWFQYMLVDVMLFLLSCFWATIFLIYFVIRKIIDFIRHKKSLKQKLY